MTGVDFERAILTRLAQAHATVDAATLSALARYLVILQRWNRRINLTAFDLDRPTDHAIDRLIVEPVVTVNELAESDRVIIDVGSGGGSPAVPLKVVRPQLDMTLVEARVRKSAFLREAARDLHLGDVRVETLRLERAGLADRNGTADVVTMRAVRADADVLEGVRQLLAPAGRLFWFHDPAAVSVADMSGWLELRANPRTLSFLRVLRAV
jgi:16S rRNA (guanine527-N7)-methyltransferase